MLTTYGLSGTADIDYGPALPQTGTEGQIFFQLSQPYYELPNGGTSAQFLRGDGTWSNTLIGSLYINSSEDVGVNQSGSLVIGNKAGENIGIDNNEIMARNNSANSTLYLNSEGGQVYVGSGGVSSVGTVASTAGYLRSTYNGNTVNIGSQNAGFCHIYNSADIPFIFNNTVTTTAGDLGNTSYAFNNARFKGTINLGGRWNNTSSNGMLLGGGYIEIWGGTPYIDFHYNNTTTDYDIRLINQTSGALYCTGNLWAQGAGERYFRAVNTNTGVHVLLDSDSTNHGIWSNGYWNGSAFTGSGAWIIYRGTDSYAHSALRLYGAVWNDYAEYRQTKEKIEPGRCIREIGDDTLELTTERLMRGCEIVSDTFGFAIGKSEKNKTPTAASGRVLAYLYEDREEAKKKIGWPVCSGPNGTVSIMTEEEEEKYPSRIIGTISAVPDYETWRAGDLDSDTEEEIQVNGRIWIRIR